MSRAAAVSFSALRVRVDALSHDEVLHTIESFVRAETQSQAFAISASSLNNLAVAQRDPQYREVMNQLDLVVPDGFPLYLLCRYFGAKLTERTYGPELMRRTIERGSSHLRHFILGGSEDALRLCFTRFDSLRAGGIVGTYSPPFGDTSAEEAERIRERITRSGANVVWVCLGSPKQEHWAIENRALLPGCVLVAVGAAVDFLAGTKRQAPPWMQKSGLEWLFRLLTEPKRLWRRYLLDLPPTVIALIWELVARRKTSALSRSAVKSRE